MSISPVGKLLPVVRNTEMGGPFRDVIAATQLREFSLVVLYLGEYPFEHGPPISCTGRLAHVASPFTTITTTAAHSAAVRPTTPTSAVILATVLAESSGGYGDSLLETAFATLLALIAPPTRRHTADMSLSE